MNARAGRQNRERGQGLVEYALILVLASVAVIVVLSLTGTSVANTFCTVVKAIDSTRPCGAAAAAPAPAQPQEGDVCVSYTFEPHPWYYIWRYTNGNWNRIPEIGGVRPTCPFSQNPDNGSRNPYI